MQYQLQAFETEDHREFRTIYIDGEPWFVLADVCRALELATHNGSFSHHAARLDEDERRTVPSSAIYGSTSMSGKEVENPQRGGARNFIIISESGLYSLILRSDKPGAKQFKKWITSQVLPAIRKTGSYSTGNKPIPVEWQPFHDRVSPAWGAVPKGYFSIFEEMVELIVPLI